MRTYALSFLLQKVRAGLGLVQFTAFESECHLEGSQRCLLSYGTYLMLFHIRTGSTNGSCLLYVVVQHSTPGVYRAQDGPGACGSSRFLGISGLTSLEVPLHHPLFATRKNHDEMEAIEGL